MELAKIIEESLRIKNLLADFEERKFGRKWSKIELYISLVSDIGDLSRLILAKSGVRDVVNVDKKIDHEFSDLLWGVLVLAKEYDVDIEQAFLKNMRQLEERIKNDFN